MQGGSRLLHLLLSRHTEGRRLGGVCRGFFAAVCRDLGGSAGLTGGVALGGLAVSGDLFRRGFALGGLFCDHAVGRFLRDGCTGVGVGGRREDVGLLGVRLVLVSLSSPPRTAAMRALASLTEFSSGFMT